MSMTNEERQTLVRRELEKAHVIGTCPFYVANQIIGLSFSIV